MTGIGGKRDGEEWQDHDDAPLETEQLALADEDDRLPWLESPDDDDDDSEYESSDWGRLLGFAVMGLVVLGVLIGGIYWVTHRNADTALVADGSVVPADDKPYKEAPKNPGGKTFDGTGDTSFAVSEGQNKPARLGGEAAGPAPVQAPAAPAPTAGATKPAGAAPAGSGGGAVGVQVGAFSSQAAAEAGWKTIGGKAGTLLSGVSHRVIAGQADNGTIYRLQAVAGDAAAANALCGKLKAAGVACQVK